MSNELAIILPEEWQVLTQQANALVASGFLPPSVNNPQKAIAIMTLGRELGVGAWAALSSINVIQGKPTVSPQLMLALINRSGQLEDMKISDDGTTCTVAMKRKGRTGHVSTFSMHDAASMGLNGKDNWKKQPGIMRQWRAVAAAARVVFPDVVLGLYTPEEMGANVEADEQGNMTVIEVKREAPAEPLRLIEPSASPDQPSSSVRGAGIPQTTPKLNDPTPEELERIAQGIEEVLEADLVDTPPNLYTCTALVVNKTRTATQFILKAGQTNIPMSDYPALDTLHINGAPLPALQAATYPLDPAWRVQADKVNGAWEVYSVTAPEAEAI